MATPTYDLIASNVLSSNADNVTFSSIPSTYRDLAIVINATITSGNNSGWLRFNSDSSSIYSRNAMQGNGATKNSSAATAQNNLYISNTDAFSSTVRGLVRIDILDYSSTVKHKTGFIRVDRADGLTSFLTFKYGSTSAISSVLIDTDGTYASGSTFYLYGIAS